MKIRVYYIEDSDKDFIEFSKELNNGKIEVLPSIDDWYAESHVVNSYVQSPSSENKKNLVDLLISKNCDLFIVDIKLFTKDLGGKDLIEQVLFEDDVLKNKKVVVLAGKPPQINSDQNRNYRAVTKLRGTITEVDYKKTTQALLNSIYDMYEIKESFVDDIKNNTIGFIRDLYK